MESTHLKKMDILETENAINFVKKNFRELITKALNLHWVSAPIFIEQGTGIQDNLNGTEKPVSFITEAYSPSPVFEIVHSLAKWKREAIYRYGIKTGEGICTDMKAIRPSEKDLTTGIHSIFVDQWDWELSIDISDRNLEKLKNIVKKIYDAIRKTGELVEEEFSIPAFLPDEIKFIHSEDLYYMYPDLTPQERENQICLEYGAVFIIGIGGLLPDGRTHDGRAPDYDDWSTESGNGFKGLNGDILFYNPVIARGLEISSMGIRVNSESLLRQLKITGAENRIEYPFHKKLINGELPQTIGGGIGQSRLAMFLLKKKHIGEVQAGYWPPQLRSALQRTGVHVL